MRKLRNWTAHYWSNTVHKAWIFLYMSCFCCRLMWRAIMHDVSKYYPCEARRFVRTISKLRESQYGSPAYKMTLARMGKAIKHHYANNRHHPEHFENGIKGMELLDLIEMTCDWQASIKKHTNGDIHKSLVCNKKRFALSPDLASILSNTCEKKVTE